MSRFPAAHAASVGAAAARTLEPFAVVNATHDATARSHALRIRLPGSKSLTNRHLVLAALAEGTTELRGILQGGVFHENGAAAGAHGRFGGLWGAH